VICASTGHDVGVGVAEVGVQRPDAEHPGAPQQVAAQQQLGRRAVRQRGSVGDDGSRPADVLLEVTERRGRRTFTARREKREEA
jgi:hypothetical protein